MGPKQCATELEPEYVERLSYYKRYDPSVGLLCDLYTPYTPYTPVGLLCDLSTPYTPYTPVGLLCDLSTPGRSNTPREDCEPFGSGRLGSK